MDSPNAAPRSGIRRFLRRIQVFAPLALLFLTACPGEWECRIPGRCSDEDPGLDPHHVYSLEIIPPVIYADLRTPFKVDAQALDENGRVISGAGLSFVWTAGDDGVFVMPGGSTTSVAVVGPRVERRVINGAIQVTAGGMSATADIIASDPGRSGFSFDRIQIEHPGLATSDAPLETAAEDLAWAPEEMALNPPRPTAVVLDAKANGVCRIDWIMAVASGGLMEEDISGDCPSTGSEVAVIPDRGRAFGEGGTFISRNAEGLPDLSPLTGDLWGVGSVGIWPAELKEPVPVEVVVWPLVADISDENLLTITEDLSLAQEILNKSRVGISLEPITWQTPASPRPKSLTVSGSNCLWGSGIEELIGSEAYEEESPKVHVVYLEDTGQHAKGGICLWGKDRNFALALVDVHKRAPTTLVHELGHLLAMNDSTLANSGHTFGFNGFDASNVMWFSEDPNSPSNRDRFTVGQAFRMNLDRRSWLNFVDPVRATKCCQANPFSNKPCPDLWKDLRPVEDPGGEEWDMGLRSCMWWED